MGEKIAWALVPVICSSVKEVEGVIVVVGCCYLGGSRRMQVTIEAGLSR